MTLKYRHIKHIGRCDICRAMDETLMHALISCTRAKKFWVAAKDRLELHLPRLHPDTWARDILLDRLFSDDARCKIITIMHAIWSSRNRWTHDEEGYDPVMAIKRNSLTPRTSGAKYQVGSWAILATSGGRMDHNQYRWVGVF